MTLRRKILDLTAVFLLVVCFPLAAQVDDCSFDLQISGMMSQISQDSIEMHVANLADAGGHESRVSFTAGNSWAAEYIKTAFESFPGLTSVAYETFVPLQTTPPYDTIPLVNVVATLEGAVTPEQYYIVGGHFDGTANLDPDLNWETDWPTARSPGADDNATGIAAILEIARVLSDPANGFTPPKTIKFIAFGAEERHPAYNNNHWGSRYYAQQAFLRGDDIFGVYILDMIGYNNTGNHYFNVVSNGSSRILGRSLLNVNQVYQVGLDANRDPFPEATYSDHEQFWLYRWRAILVIENAPPWNNNLPWYTANPFYHRQTDAAGTINYEQVTRIAKMTLGALACQANIVTGIDPADLVNSPYSFTLLQNFPNPFNPATTIRYQLLFGGTVSLRVYAPTGQFVAEIVHERQPPGEYRYEWTAKDAGGRPLASGIYLLALRFEGQEQIRKMLLLK